MNKCIFAFGIFIICFLNLYSQEGWIVQNAPSTLRLNSIQFLNSETGYSIGTDYSIGNFVFLKTTNGGNNWVSQYEATNTYKNPMNLFFTDALTGYSVGGDAFLQYSGCFFKTTNGGTNWITSQLQDITIFRGIYFLNSNTGFISGTFGNLLKTTNMGNNWVYLNSGSSDALNSIYFINDNTGFVAGSNGRIIKTTDSGNSWTNQVSGTILSLKSIYFVNSELGFACGTASFGSSNVLLKTTNSGNNWNIVLADSSISNHYFKSVYFSTTDDGYICSNLRIMKTTNSGASWFYLDLPINNFMQSTFGNSISFVNLNTGYVCGSSGNSVILKTVNGGTSTIPVAPTGLGLGQFINPKRVYIAWNDNSYIENGYKIERKLRTDTTWLTIDSVTTNVMNYYDYNITQGKTYFYRVYAYNGNGSSNYSNTDSITITITSINSIESNIGKKYSISQNYPNPFNPNTVIRYQLPVISDVVLKVYDVMGREVEMLVNERLQPGTYETTFDGSRLNSGVYFYRLVTEGFNETKRMLLIK